MALVHKIKLQILLLLVMTVLHQIHPQIPQTTTQALQTKPIIPLIITTQIIIQVLIHHQTTHQIPLNQLEQLENSVPG